MNYNNYEKLIHKISWSWHKTTGIELETLTAEANVAFVECQNSYNFLKGKFSTILWYTIENRFKNLLTYNNQKRHNGIEVKLEDQILFSPAIQEKRCIFKDTLNNLSKEARQITTIILNTPSDLMAMLPKQILSKSQLTKYLRSKGWKFTAISRAFTEIKESLNYF